MNHLEMDNNCICTRPLASVLCRNCGYRLGNCRKKMECPEHKNVTYLQDLTECPKCHNSKDYLHEYDEKKCNSAAAKVLNNKMKATI